MRIDIFKKRPYSVMVEVSQSEAWELVKSLVTNIQRNDPNTERKEFFDTKGQYFSIAVTPEPIRLLTKWDMRTLTDSYTELLDYLKLRKDRAGRMLYETLKESLFSKEMEATLTKLKKIYEVDSNENKRGKEGKGQVTD